MRDYHMICDLWRRGKCCLYCTEGAKARRYYKGHYGYRVDCRKREKVSEMIRRQSAESKDVPPGSPAARDEVLEADNPLLMEYLTATTFGDGSERETATLLVFASGGAWKACLNDRAEGQALWVSAASIGACLEALERALDTQAPDWRRTAKPTFRKKP